MTTEPEDLPSLSKGPAVTQPRQCINRALPWGHFLLLSQASQPSPGMALSRTCQTLSFQAPHPGRLCPNMVPAHRKRPLSLSPVLPPQPHTTLGCRPHGKTPEIARPLLFSPSLYHRKAGSSESSRSVAKVKRFPRSEGRKIGPTPWKASASHGGYSNFHSHLQSKLVRGKHFQLFIKFSSSHLLGPPIFLSCCVTPPWG